VGLVITDPYTPYLVPFGSPVNGACAVCSRKVNLPEFIFLSALLALHTICNTCMFDLFHVSPCY